MIRVKTEYIVVHHSATRKEMDTDAATIDAWHRARGFDRIGYHWVIKRDGTVERGRQTGTVGAHVRGFNKVSEGICLIGGLGDDVDVPEDNYTQAQKVALGELVEYLRNLYPNAKVVRHQDLDPRKPYCPYSTLGDLGVTDVRPVANTSARFG